MRLDDPQLRPGETEEQRKQRLVKAAKLQATAIQARALANRSGLAVRVIRLIVLLVLGLGLTIATIYQLSRGQWNPPADGRLVQVLGPTGVAVLFLVAGLLLSWCAIHFLRKAMRDVRAGRYKLPS